MYNYFCKLNNMSARVFKPILSEMPKMRSSPSLDVKVASRNINKVRRVLFNPPDPEETSLFLDDELNKIAVAQSDRWNFDFLSGRPITVDTTAGCNSPQYLWIPVCSGISSVLLPDCALRPESPDLSDLYPPILKSQPLIPEKMAIDDALSPSNAATPKKELQRKMTDFLPVRKRTEASASPAKKLTGSTSRPRKIPRITS